MIRSITRRTPRRVIEQMNPKLEIVALHIRNFAKPLAHDVTYSDVAEALDVSRQLVVAAIKYKGWEALFRVESTYLARAVNPMIAAHMARDIVAGRIGVSL